MNNTLLIIRVRRKTLEELNKIDNTDYEKLLKAIEYHYYSKKYTNGKEKRNLIKKELKLSKNFY